MPNKHHFLVDLSPFGLENPNEVFYADDRPYGLIEAAVVRDDAPDPGPTGTPTPSSDGRRTASARAFCCDNGDRGVDRADLGRDRIEPQLRTSQTKSVKLWCSTPAKSASGRGPRRCGGTRT